MRGAVSRPDVRGQVISLSKAIEVGRAIFGDVLNNA